MTVGILDLDLLFKRPTYQLNLDVMQISAYYKKKNDKVKLCLSTKTEDLGWFSIIYIIYNQEQDIFLDIMKDNRTILIGKYFYKQSSGLPQEIKDCYPDKTIYDNLLRSGFLSKDREKELYNILYKTDYIRLHEPSNLKFISTDSKQIILYDQDIGDYDYETISKINKKFILYYPITIRKLENGTKWMKLKAFGKKSTQYIFIAKNFIEKDLMDFLKLPYSQRKLFLISFGNCSEEFYSIELKKFIRFAQKAKTLNVSPRIIISPINDPDYEFLFNLVKRWYNGKKDNIIISLFKYGFTKKEHFYLAEKIKAKDPELYTLLTSTWDERCKNNEAREYYRRVD